MKRVSKLWLILPLLFCTLAVANSSVSVGVGPQYAGFIGVQVARVKDRHKMRGSLGVLGVSAGYEFLVSPVIGLGAGVFRYHDISDDISGFGLNANYYFAPVDARGFVIGLDVLNQHVRDATASERKEGVVVLFSAGYRF